MADLKQTVIDNIRAEGFDMEYFGALDDLKRGEVKGCGTACCIAGHIVAAAARLKLTTPGRKQHYMEDLSTVDVLARQIWADQYGQGQADRLCFGSYTDPVDDAWGELSLVTPEEAIAHINGADPVYHDPEEMDE
jgi:hypothetical protein